MDKADVKDAVIDALKDSSVVDDPLRAPIEHGGKASEDQISVIDAIRNCITEAHEDRVEGNSPTLLALKAITEKLDAQTNIDEDAIAKSLFAKMNGYPEKIAELLAGSISQNTAEATLELLQNRLAQEG